MEIWRGKSKLDGQEIVVIATADSKNEKTGDMVQINILRADVHPTEAQRSGLDKSICGDCRFRPTMMWKAREEGADPAKQDVCYVVTMHGPGASWKAWKNGGHSDPKHISYVTDRLYDTPIRFGAYGDPSAVPLHIWHKILNKSMAKWTGYTHQWKNPKFDVLKYFLMASCDSVEDAKLAQSMGWRTFTAVMDGDEPPEGSMLCKNSEYGTQCADCLLCDGKRFDDNDTRKSIWLHAHGKVQEMRRRRRDEKGKLHLEMSSGSGKSFEGVRWYPAEVEMDPVLRRHVHESIDVVMKRYQK